MNDSDIRELIYMIGALHGVCTSLQSRIEIKEPEIKHYYSILDEFRETLRTVVGHYMPVEQDVEPS